MANYLINRNGAEKGKKLIITFVDMMAAFDSVDREVFVRMMRRRGIRECLVKRCEELIGETVSRMTEWGTEKGIYSGRERGLRQGCPLSLTLFTLLIADLEEELEKGGCGGTRIIRRKLYALADDVAVLAESEAGMTG